MLLVTQLFMLDGISMMLRQLVLEIDTRTLCGLVHGKVLGESRVHVVGSIVDKTLHAFVVLAGTDYRYARHGHV
jgi:hypothetical protein